MTCGTFDFACHIGAFLSPWLFWIKIAGIAFAVILALWAFAKLKEIGGWPAVLGALVAAAAAGGYIVRARQDRVAGKGRGGGYYLTDEDRKAVQRALAARHLYPGEIDGQLGTKTRAGIRTLQRNMNPPEDETGTLTPRVLKALGLKF